MKKFLTIIVFSIAFIQASFSQEKKNETLSLNFGFDAASPLMQFIEPDWKNYEGSVTAGVYKNFLFTIEGGYMDFAMNKNEPTKAYDYKANGSYLRLGPSFNIFRRVIPNEQHLIYFGLHYGTSKTHFSASNIFINDSIWQPRYAVFPEKTFNAHWIEGIFGLKVELLRYVSMGWTVRYKILLSPRNAIDKPYYIAGFGKGNENTALGFTYSLYFTLPFNY